MKKIFVSIAVILFLGGLGSCSTRKLTASSGETIRDSVLVVERTNCSDVLAGMIRCRNMEADSVLVSVYEKGSDVKIYGVRTSDSISAHLEAEISETFSDSTVHSAVDREERTIEKERPSYTGNVVLRFAAALILLFLLRILVSPRRKA